MGIPDIFPFPPGANSGNFLRRAANLSDLEDGEVASLNLLFRFLSDEAVVRSITAKLRENALSLLDISGAEAVSDGVANASPVIQRAVDTAAKLRKNLYIPGYPYMWNMQDTVEFNPIPLADYDLHPDLVEGDPGPANTPGTIAPGLVMFGDGMAVTSILPRVANGYAFKFNVTDPSATPPNAYAYRLGQGWSISQLCFIGSNAVAMAGAIQLFNVNQAKISQCHFRNHSGTALKLINGVVGTVPDSGWNMVDISLNWFEGNANDGDGWALDATGETNRNEGSFTSIKQNLFQGNGNNEWFTVTNISTDNPAVVTVSLNQIPQTSPVKTTHKFVEDEEILFFGLAGATELNENIYKVGPSPTATTFTLYTTAGAPVNGATLSAWARKAAVALANNPITTTNGSTTVTVAATAHGYKVGHMATISGAAAVGGITLNGEYRITAVPDPNSFRVTHSSAATSAATGGGAGVSVIFESVADHGEVGRRIPKSGGLRHKNQLTSVELCGFTVNQNCAELIYGDNGLGIGGSHKQVSWENSFRRHLVVTGITNFDAQMCQFHGNDDYRQWVLADFDGKDYAIRQVLFQNTKVRARLGYGTAFRLKGINAVPYSVRIRGTVWDDYDYFTQKRYDGIEFDQIDQDLELSFLSTTVLAFRANQTQGRGNKSPIRLAGPCNAVGTGVRSTTGEWVEWQPTSNGGVFCYNTTTGKNGGPALANNTIYNIYLYDDDGVGALVPSTDAPTISSNHGYMTRTGEPSMLWVGRMATDGAGLWTANSHAYLNPAILPGHVAGTPEFGWRNEADKKFYIKTGSLPTSAAGGNWAWWPVYEYSVAYDPPNLVAGTTRYTDHAVTAAAGDVCIGVQFSLGWGDVEVSATHKSANVVRLKEHNPTGADIDLGSGTVRYFYLKRS